MGREYNCFILDDNALDRLTTVSFVRKYGFLKITGTFGEGETAMKAAQEQKPDVVFLDIDMPDINGLDLRQKLESVPACIFITAYPDYALPAFDVNALDFMVKPLRPDRFDKAMIRLHEYLTIHFQNEIKEHSLSPDFIFIKDGRENIKIRFQDILYLEALKDYTGIVTTEKKYCVLAPLGNLLREKEFAHFIRIHRSYAVHKQSVVRYTAEEVQVKQVLLPVGRTFKEALKFL